MDFLGVVLDPTMLEVTSGYSASENHFLAELEVEATDNQLKTDGLLV